MSYVRCSLLVVSLCQYLPRIKLFLIISLLNWIISWSFHIQPVAFRCGILWPTFREQAPVLWFIFPKIRFLLLFVLVSGPTVWRLVSSAVMGALRLLLLLCAILPVRICSVRCSTKSPSATVPIAIWKTRTSIAASRTNSTVSVSSKRSACFFLLLLCGDIASNPGPMDNNSCCFCHKIFRGNSKPVQCLSCGSKVHTTCSHMTAADRSSGVAWYCQPSCYPDNYWTDLPFAACSTPPSPVFRTRRCQPSPVHSAVPCSVPDEHPVLPIAELSSLSIDSIQISPPQTPSPVPRIRSQSHPLILSVNCNSLLSKIDEIRSILCTSDADILAVQETKLDSSINDAEIAVPGYSIFRNDRSWNSGGVLLFIRSSLKPKSIKIAVASGLLLVAAEVAFRNRSIIVATAYRSPGQSACARDNFLSNLQDVLASLGSRVHDLVLTGDFNFCALDSHEFTPLQTIARNFGLSQIVTEPTHRNRCLDCVFIGQNLSVFDCSVTTPVEKYHCLVRCELEQLTKPALSEHRIMSWSWHLADWERARFLLQYHTDGSIRDLAGELSACSSVSDAADYLNRCLRDIVSLCVPHRQRRLKHKPVPWFTSEIAKAIKKRDSAFADARRHSNLSKWAKFRRLRKAAKKAVISAKRTYFVDSFYEVKTSRDFWRAVKKCSGAGHPTVPSLLRSDESFAVSGKEKADLLADTYAASFNKNDCPPPLYDSADHQIDPSWLCTPDFVSRELKGLSSTAPTGLDLVPVCVLKECADQLAVPIADLLNRALANGQFPNVWKCARICALPKKGNSNAPKDYRPISILPVLSKVAERWLATLITTYVSLSPFQFAYTKGRSTEDALAFLQCTVANGFEDCVGRAKVAAVAFDILKAFDTVPKNALLRQLEQCWNVPVPILCLVKDYLSDRSQTVCVDKEMSHTVPIESGVPQGSVLGGLLFCAYVDSVLSLELSPGAKMIMYADDLILLKPLPTPVAEQELQRDVVLIAGKYSSLFLQLNVQKTQLMLFSLSPVPASLSILPQISGTPLVVTESLVYLGFTLDRRLQFNLHAAQAVMRGKRALGALHRTLGRLAGPEVFARVVQAKILPMLLYGVAVAAPSGQSYLMGLEKLCRFAARLATNDFHSSYFDLLYRLQWKNVNRICFERRAMLAFKYVYFLRHLPGDCLRIAVQTGRFSERIFQRNWNSLQLYIPPFSKKSCDNIPVFELFRVWNALPDPIVSLTTFHTFRSNVQSPVLYSMVQSRIPSTVILLDDL